MSEKPVDDYVSRAAVIAAIEACCDDPYLKENYPDNVIEEISRIPLVNAVSCEDLKIAMARVEGGS